MTRKRLFSATLLAALCAGFASPSALAASYKTLYAFTGKADGAIPTGGFVLTKQGKFIGTAMIGGTVDNANYCGDGCGTIFELDPATGKVTTLYKFTGGADGESVNGNLVAGSGGTIYGSTGFGGTDRGGTIFKIDPVTKALTTLYAFSSTGAGTNPLAGFVIGKDGNLYGATFFGGRNDFGAIFKFNPATRVMTAPQAFGPDGVANANGGMVADKNGYIYGTAESGGPHNSGTLFRFNPATGGLKILHAFSAAEGGQPSGGLAIGGQGNLFGLTAQGGKVSANCGGGGCGSAYEFNPATGKFTVMHSFTGGVDGGGPGGEMTFDSAGMLYGETQFGGANKAGTLFKLNPGSHALTTLHNFAGGSGGKVGNGQKITFGGQGALYGVANSGGKSNPKICGSGGCGLLFKVVQN